MEDVANQRTPPAIARFPLHLLDPKSNADRERQVVRDTEDAKSHERRLFCMRCRYAITHHDQRIAINGAHEHTCTNPLGMTFHIGCFRDAPGGAASGTPMTEHTWFLGYAWRIATCRQCSTHLGWSFEKSDEAFYGLILDRLTSAEEET